MCRGFDEKKDLKVYEECGEACFVHIYVFIDKRSAKSIVIDKRSNESNRLFSTAQWFPYLEC